MLSAKDIFDIGRFFYELQASKTPYEIFKFILTKSYFNLIKDKCSGIEKEYVENILFTQELVYPECRLFDTKNIKDHEFFIYIDTKVSNKCKDLDFNYIKEHIQLEVETELYYNKDNQNIKGLKEYLNSNLFKERKKLILKNIYQKKLTEYTYKYKYEFIEETIFRGIGNLDILFDDIKSEGKFFIFGHKGQGKTFIAHKILNQKLFEKQYLINFDDIDFSLLTKRDRIKNMKDILKDDIGLDRDEELDLEGLIIFDNVTKVNYLEKLIEVLKDEQFSDVTTITFLPNFDEIKCIVDDESFEIREVDTPNEKYFANSFDELFQKYGNLSTIKQNKLKQIAYKIYLGLEVSILEKIDFHINFYITEKFQNYLAGLQVFSLFENYEDKNNEIKEFFTKKNIPAEVIDSYKKYDSKNELKQYILKLLKEVIENEEISVFGNISFKTLHQFYSYWSLLNSFEDDTDDYFGYKLEKKEKDNLIYLIKIYKSIYYEEKLKFYNQSFNESDICKNINFSYCEFKNCTFNELDLENTNFYMSKIISCNFFNAILENTNFTKVELIGNEHNYTEVQFNE